MSGALYSEDEHRQALVEEALEKKRKEDELTVGPPGFFCVVVITICNVEVHDWGCV